MNVEWPSVSTEARRVASEVKICPYRSSIVAPIIFSIAEDTFIRGGNISTPCTRGVLRYMKYVKHASLVHFLGVHGKFIERVSRTFH